MSTTSATPESVYLVALARELAGEFSTLPSVRASMISGSAAEGCSDRYSDVDMMVYYDLLPADEELDSSRVRNKGGERLWLAGDRTTGALMESYRVRGVECQIVHVTIAAWERDMATVLEQYTADTPLQKALAGTLTATPLF